MSARGSRPTLVVLAKAPVAGRSKTRCTPPCTPVEAAALATAALHDTLLAVSATPAPRRVLVLDGVPGAWLPPGFEVLPQRAGGLDRRLAGAFADVGGPALLIGMDTPQLCPQVLEATADLLAVDVDAVLGPAADGGYWAVGLQRADRRVFLGVPMSEATTLAAQRARLAALGQRVVDGPVLVDVDHWVDAIAVAARVPGSGFAGEVERISEAIAGRAAVPRSA